MNWLTKFIRFGLLGVVLTLAVPTFAAGYMDFMENSVLSEFTESNIKSFKATIRQALEDSPGYRNYPMAILIQWSGGQSPGQGELPKQWFKLPQNPF